MLGFNQFCSKTFNPQKRTRRQHKICGLYKIPNLKRGCTVIRRRTRKTNVSTRLRTEPYTAVKTTRATLLNRLSHLIKQYPEKIISSIWNSPGPG